MLSDSHIHLSHPLFDGEVTCVNTEGSDETLVTANRDVLVDKMKKAGIAFCVEPAIELESNARILQYAGRYSDFYIPRSVCTRQEVFKQNGSIEKNWKIFLKTQVWSQSESWGWIIITNERNNIA